MRAGTGRSPAGLPRSEHACSNSARFRAPASARCASLRLGGPRVRLRGVPGRKRSSVHSLAQLLAGLEMRHVLFGHVHFLARLRVAPDPRRAVVEPEAAEPANLDPVRANQRMRHGVENHLHGVLGVLRHELRVALRKARNQFGLRQDGPPIANRQTPAYSWPGVFLSSLARSSAPRFVAPALAAAFSVRSCFIASVSSASSLAFTDRLIERFLRSTLMIIACTASPSFRCVRRS